MRLTSGSSCPTSTIGCGALNDASSTRFARRSVEEREILHRLCLVLGVHEHLVPVMQDDRAMVGVANPAPDIHAHIAPHASASPRRLPLGWR